MAMPPLFAFDAVTKCFVENQPVLDNVSLAFQRGEIHAVVGENGAGKSTLLNILFGLHQPTSGGLLINGRQVIHHSPADAIASGIGMVHQHFKLVPSFSVAENVRLGAPRAIRRTLRSDSDISAIASEYGIAINPRAIVSQLPLALQQRVEILKALVNRADMLLLDEPTTILNPDEIVMLYTVLKRIAASGRAVAVVTHHLDEVFAHADRVSVIRLGRVISSGEVVDRTRDALVTDIVGRRIELAAPLERKDSAEPVSELSLCNVWVAPSPSSSGISDFSLDLRAGEIVGIAGVEGNGQRELFELVAGLRRPDKGEIHARKTHADGRPLAGLVPEDRHHEGLVLDLPIRLNLLLGRIGEPRYSRLTRLDHAAIDANAARMREDFDIRARSIHATPRTLSGGNQQKIVLARALDGQNPVVAVYQPTRGLDIAASEDVLARLRRSANEGRAVLLISSNLNEILRISDRIVVLYGGRKAGEVDANAPLEKIGRLMTGGEPRSVKEEKAVTA